MRMIILAVAPLADDVTECIVRRCRLGSVGGRCFCSAVTAVTAASAATAA